MSSIAAGPPGGARSFDRLLQDRHPTPDFFVCDIFEAAPKGDLASMEHPIFSLSTKPDTRVLSYEHNGAQITVTPGIAVD